MYTTNVMTLSLILTLEMTTANLLFDDASKISLSSLSSWELVFLL